MAKREISQEDLDQLKEDACYLQNEAEALTYVIEEVPYRQNPPGERSIAELLLYIDHAQLSYYRPVLETAFKKTRPVRLSDFPHFEETFEVEEEKLDDIQKVLRKISKHRAAVINVIDNIPLIDWETIIYGDEKTLTMYDFIKEMVRFDRLILKKIAEQVMAYSQQRHAQREIEQKQQLRQQTDNT